MADPQTMVDVAVDNHVPRPGMCHSCGRRPVADVADKTLTDSRLEQLARDDDPAVAHIAGAALAHGYDAIAWERMARDLSKRPSVGSLGSPDAGRLRTSQKWAVVEREVARELQVVAQDAKAVSVP